MNAAELELQKQATMAFILADADDIVLERRAESSDGAGGKVHSSYAPLAEQTVRLIPQSPNVPEVADVNGRMAVPQFVLLMEIGGDIERGDQFDWRGRRWEVAQVKEKPDYEIKADVIRVGRDAS